MARAADGTVSILQPLTAPLWGGLTEHELLSAFTDPAGRSALEIVRQHWKKALGETDFDKRWQKALNDGVIAGTAFPTPEGGIFLVYGEWMRRPTTTTVPTPPAPGALDVVFRADPGVHDGRYANNGWLQELPRPLTKLTWDNAAIVSPNTAQRLGIEIEQTAAGHATPVLKLELNGRTVEAAAWILPGQPDETVTVHLGYGRRRAGRVGTGAGFDAYRLRTSREPWFASGLRVTKTAKRAWLACTQDHWSIDRTADRAAEERHLIRSASLEEYRKDPEVFAKMGEPLRPGLSMYPEVPDEGQHAWGLSIDLGTCVGCNACVVACQAENNIPVVGREQVARGREMHWIRVDRYYEGPPDSPVVHHQPVTCMQCENAPCETVCPVAATVHSEEGLNDMVYNRCVGTRYCSNNCPYKVRRFNFFLYQDWTTPSLKLVRNPDVTVRSRACIPTILPQRILHRTTRCPAGADSVLQAFRRGNTGRRLRQPSREGPGSRRNGRQLPTRARRARGCRTPRDGAARASVTVTSKFVHGPGAGVPVNVPSGDSASPAGIPVPRSTCTAASRRYASSLPRRQLGGHHGDPEHLDLELLDIHARRRLSLVRQAHEEREGRPPGLVRGTEAASGVAVEVFVEEDEVLPGPTATGWRPSSIS